MADIAIEFAKDAPPVVLGVATNLKRSAANPKLARRLKKMKGVLALKSSVDPQCATIRFDRGTVRLSQGAARDADVVITLDFNDASAKPKVKGAARHPLLALGAAKVLEPPTGRWQQEAEGFWAFARDTPRMPASLRVVCLDDGSEIHLGEPGDPAYEIHGTDDGLRAMFSGTSIFGAVMLEGKLQVVGSLEHASILTGRSIAWVMGEGR